MKTPSFTPALLLATFLTTVSVPALGSDEPTKGELERTPQTLAWCLEPTSLAHNPPRPDQESTLLPVTAPRRPSSLRILVLKGPDSAFSSKNLEKVNRFRNSPQGEWPQEHGRPQ